MRKFDYPDLTDTSLDLNLGNAKYPIVMLAAVCRKYPDITEFLKL